MKSEGEVMEILEAFDLCGSARAAAQLSGSSHNTVLRYASLRDAGKPMERKKHPSLIDSHIEKIEEWVERSNGKIRADVAHERLVTMGFEGSERTTRRAVAEMKRRYRHGKQRVFRPWITEPGMWFQFDWSDGPKVNGRRTRLFCAWHSWSRFRVVIPTWDQTLPTLIACLDRTLREFGGVPTYALTDNAKTVTTEHIARIPVRHPEIVSAARHYGLSVHTCVPYDPQSKGGSEATVRIAQADLVPTDSNLRDIYASFAQLELDCLKFADEVNARAHRITRRSPIDMLQVERSRLHPVPQQPYVSAFGETRRVSWSSLISYRGVRYSVPHILAGDVVRVRDEGDEVVLVHLSSEGPREVARHAAASPGDTQINDNHYPPKPDGPINRRPMANNIEEAAFLEIGEGAEAWLVHAAANGVSGIKRKMAEAVALSTIHGKRKVNGALETAAKHERFESEDLESITARSFGMPTSEINETKSLQPGTSAWKGAGR